MNNKWNPDNIGSSGRTQTHTERGIVIYTPLPNHVIDNDGVRVLQQARQFHGNLREPHARTAEDLNREQSEH